MKRLSYKANDVLSELFDKAGLILVDFKLEFGLFNGKVVLGMNSHQMVAVYGIKTP